MLNLMHTDAGYAAMVDVALDSFHKAAPFSNLNEKEISDLKEKMRTHFLNKYQEENKERLLFEASIKPAVDVLASTMTRVVYDQIFSCAIKNDEQGNDVKDILKSHMEAATRDVMKRIAGD